MSNKDEEMDIKDLQKEETQKRLAQADLRNHISKLEELIEKYNRIEEKKARKETLTCEEEQLTQKCTMEKLRSKLNSYLDQSKKFRKEIGEINKEMASIAKAVEQKQGAKVRPNL